MRICGSPMGRVSHGWPLTLFLLAWLLWVPAAQADEGKPGAEMATDAGVPEICQAADPAATQNALVRMRQSVIEATTPKPQSLSSQAPKGIQREVLNGRGFNYARSSVRDAPPPSP
jgi:hypothetical protein